MGRSGWAAAIVGAALAAAVGCTRPAPAPPPEAVAARFVGSDACAPCHAAEFTSHRATRHATTLHRAGADMDPKVAPPTGPIPGTDYAISRRDGKLWIGLAADPTKADTIDLAFGSGHAGVTYAAVMGNALAEVRMSYDPGRRRWFKTPGQELMRDRKLGKIHRGEFARRCVQCHAVALPDERALPEPGLLGVGCESCHGAGSAHVDAARAGRSPGSPIGRLSRADAKTINATCDTCHTVGQPVAEGDLEASEAATRRFPLYGLAKSRCFTASQGALSCLHCHDPHTPRPTALSVFDAACLRCHGGDPAPRPGAKGAAVAGKPCPVKPTAGCVACHMPSGRAMPRSESPVEARDHFIRIYRTRR